MSEIEMWPHQIEAIERARTQKNLGLLFQPGLGKTATMIRILRDHYNSHKTMHNTLIFAPITVCFQWKKEFAKFSNICPDDILVLTGPGKKRVDELSARKKLGKPCIVITNYEAVQMTAFYELLLKWAPRIGILDESHRVKDSQSKRAKKIYPLILSCERRFILTGTPILNGLEDIFGQYKALDPTIFGGKKWDFMDKYFYDKNKGRNWGWREMSPHPWAAKAIGEIMSATSVQAKRDECLTLPPLQEIIVPVPMSEPQAKAYKELKKDFLTHVNGHLTSVEFEMTKTLRMQQILAGYAQPDEKLDPEWLEEQPRLEALMELLSSMGKAKCIIWTTFRPTYTQLAAALNKAGYKFVFITGDQDSAAKKEVSRAAFCEGDAQILVANPASASEGLNLQIAQYAIFYLRGYNLGHFVQAQARNYRAGSENFHRSIAQYHIVSPGTLDEVIADALLKKQAVGDAVLKWAKEVNISLDNDKGNADSVL